MDYFVSIIFTAFLLVTFYVNIYLQYFKVTKNMKTDIMQVYIDKELTKRYAHTRVPKRS